MKKILLYSTILITIFFAPTIVKAESTTTGSLTFNINVPSGSPMFTVSGMLPGDTITKSFSVSNSATTPQKGAIRGIKKSEYKEFADALEIVISSQSTDIYGGNSATGTKTLAQFFIDSQNITGIPLTFIPAGGTTTYDITVSLPTGVGSYYQLASVVFDLKFLTWFDIPQECEGIVFDDVLFGTDKRDMLTGTSKNELIYGYDKNDLIRGGGGQDCIVGGNGNDIIFGDDGDDVLFGNNGNDLLFGGKGNDYMYGNAGSDILYGDDGDDYLDGGANFDIMCGGNHIDTCEKSYSILCEKYL